VVVVVVAAVGGGMHRSRVKHVVTKPFGAGIIFLILAHTVYKM